MKKLAIFAVLALILAGCGNPEFHRITGLPEPGFLRDNPEAAQGLLMMQQGYQQSQPIPLPSQSIHTGTLIPMGGGWYQYYGN